MNAKSFWTSKTFWVNLIAAGGLIYQGVTGTNIGLPPETQGWILAAVNIALRLITKQPIVW